MAVDAYEEDELLTKQANSKKVGYRVLAYLSRQTTAAEKNWTTAEHEAMSLIYACSKWRHLLLSPSGPAFMKEPVFFVLSDHANLRSILTKQGDDTATQSHCKLKELVATGVSLYHRPDEPLFNSSATRA